MAIDAHWLDQCCIIRITFQHIHIKTRFVVPGVFMQDDEAGAGKYILAISFSRERFDDHYFTHFFASCDDVLQFPALLGLMFKSHVFQQETLVRYAEGDGPLETNTVGLRKAEW